MNQPVKIIIADDQTLMRDGLQTILSLEEDMEVLAVARNGQEALERVRQLRPDLVLLDVQMPVMDGIECTKMLKREFPEIRILILTTYADDDYIVEGLAGGADGFLLKDMPGEQLLQSIRDCARGQLMLPAVVAGKLAARLALVVSSGASELDALRLKAEGVSFTEREKQIVRLMIEGRSNRQMAETLFMSEGTIKNYVSMIYQKIGTNDRTKATLALRELMKD